MMNAKMTKMTIICHDKEDIIKGTKKRMKMMTKTMKMTKTTTNPPKNIRKRLRKRRQYLKRKK
jgi:hypothetical protein